MALQVVVGFMVLGTEGVVGRWIVVPSVLQAWDLLTDGYLAYTVHREGEGSLYVACVAFVACPYLLSLVLCVGLPNQVDLHAPLNTVLLVALSGGVHPALRLVNSRIFGVELFSMGLTDSVGVLKIS